MNKTTSIGLILLLGGFVIALVRFFMVDPSHADLVKTYTPIVIDTVEAVSDQGELPTADQRDPEVHVSSVLKAMVSKITVRYQTSYLEPLMMLIGGIMLLVGKRKRAGKLEQQAGEYLHEAAQNSQL